MRIRNQLRMRFLGFLLHVYGQHVRKINQQFPKPDAMIIKKERDRGNTVCAAAYLVNRHVYSDRPYYLPKPLIKGFKDRRARTKPLPLNCSRDYRFVLQPRVKHLILWRNSEAPSKILGRKRSILGILKYIQAITLIEYQRTMDLSGHDADISASSVL